MTSSSDLEIDSVANQCSGRCFRTRKRQRELEDIV
jgi:hypothetical protein